MSQPDDVLPCDETFVRFTWPHWQVRHTGTDKLSVNAEVEHTAYLVMFEVVSLEGEERTICEFGLTIESLERLVKVARAQGGTE